MLQFFSLHGDEAFLFVGRFVGTFQIISDGVGRKRIAFDFLAKNPIEVGNADFVPATPADVFRAVGWHIHFLPALALENAGKNMHRLFRGAFLFAVRFINDLVAFIPNLLAYERCNFMQIPFAFRLDRTLIGLAVAGGVIPSVNAFGRRVLQQPRDGLAREACAFAGAVAGIVQKPHDGLFAAVFQKKLIHEFPDRAFLGMGYQLFVFPFIPERSRPAKRTAVFGTDGNRSLHAINRFLAFPLRHCRNHGVEKASGGRRRINFLLQRNHVGGVLSEEISEFQKLLRVSGKSGELGKNEASDVPALHVGNHPLGFGVFHDGFAGHASKVIHFRNRPFVELGVFAGALLVVFGAVALGLVFGGNANPDAHSFFQGTIFLHILLHTRKRSGMARKKCIQIESICYGFIMSRKATMNENDLVVLAKEFRRKAGKTRAQAAREMGVKQTSIFNAEETPGQSLLKLRMRMIAAYSKFKIRGPVYFLEEK